MARNNFDEALGELDILEAKNVVIWLKYQLTDAKNKENTDEWNVTYLTHMLNQAEIDVRRKEILLQKLRAG